MKKKIFTSYSRQNSNLINDLVKDMESLGHSVWLDRELSGGAAWWREILARVRESDVFLFAISEESLKSKACRLEHEYANALGKPVLPVLLTPDVSKNTLPVSLGALQNIDYVVNDHDSALRLCRALNTLPESVELPDPLPPEPEVPISYLASLQDQVEFSGELDFENQSGLLLRIKGALRDPDTAEDGLRLLKRMQQRRDLLADIAAELRDITASFVLSSNESKEEPIAQVVSPDVQRRTLGNSIRKKHVYAFLGVAFAAAALVVGIRIDSLSFAEDTRNVDVKEMASEVPAKYQDITIASIDASEMAGEKLEALRGSVVGDELPRGNDMPDTGGLSVTEDGVNASPDADSVSADAKKNEVENATPNKGKESPRPAPARVTLPAHIPGTWRVSWTDANRISYSGMLEIKSNGRGSMQVRYVDLNGQEQFVTQSIRVNAKKDQFLIQGKNPKWLGSSNKASGRYHPDKGFLYCPNVNSIPAASFCDASDQCSRAHIRKLR